MRTSLWLAGALALLSATPGRCEPYYAFNAADFVVPADELDAVAIGEAANRAGFYPLPESDPKLRALRAGADPAYEIWELRSHDVATITLTRLSKTNAFRVLFVAKEPSRRGDPLEGEACKKWLTFSAAMRSQFGARQSRFRFRKPQCTP
jgi:hypothetical protein